MIRVDNVEYIASKKTPFEKLIIKNANFTVKEGDFLLLCGVSGSGKSTIANMLSGIIKPTSGIIRFPNNVKQRNKFLGYLIQNSYKQITKNNVYDELNYGYKAIYKENLNKEIVTEIFNSLSFNKSLEDNPLFFSGGEQKMLSLIALFVLKQKVIILDEPFTFLDQEKQQLLCTYLRNSSSTVILITHDINRVFDIATGYILIEDMIVSRVTPEVFTQMNKNEKFVEYADKQKIDIFLSKGGL